MWPDIELASPLANSRQHDPYLLSFSSIYGRLGGIDDFRCLGLASRGTRGSRPVASTPLSVKTRR